MGDYYQLLLKIAKKGYSETSTIKLAKELSLSQQTISRLLIEMEKKGLIKREVSQKGVKITLQEPGINILRENFNELKDIFDQNSIVGIIKDGIGEGRYYVGLKQYQKQFKKELGFEAFPGTLNLKVNKQSLMKFTSNKEKITIDGFEDKTRTYGSLICYKTKIKDIEAAIVMPERTRHSEEIIEIIAPISIMGALKLKSDDKVELR